MFFGMDSGGSARIIPGASVSFPNGNYFQLTANTNFYAPPFTPDYHSVLDFVSFSRVQKDDITWAPAARVVPEPTTFVLTGIGLVGLCVAALRKKYRRA